MKFIFCNFFSSSYPQPFCKNKNIQCHGERRCLARSLPLKEPRLGQREGDVLKCQSAFSLSSRDSGITVAGGPFVYLRPMSHEGLF